MTVKTLEPSASDADVAQWSEDPPVAFRLACWLARHSPRAKGWLPRAIGRAFCRNARMVIRTGHGARLAVDPMNLDIYTTVILKGAWEPEVVRACQAVTRAGDVFYDIGASAGYVSTEMARMFDDSLTLCAFEPQPSLARVVAVTARLNGFRRFSLFQTMLGEQEGSAELFIPSHSIHASAISREAGATKLTCPVVTLDRMVQDGSIPPPNVMKLDVEGGELGVFRGAAQTIRAHAPFMVFEADDNLARFGHTRAQIFGYLRSLADYSFYYVDRAATYPSVESADLPWGNFVAIPAGKGRVLRP